MLNFKIQQLETTWIYTCKTQGFGLERVFEVEVPGPGEKKLKLEASLEPWKQQCHNSNRAWWLGFGDFSGTSSMQSQSKFYRFSCDVLEGLFPFWIVSLQYFSLKQLLQLFSLFKRAWLEFFLKTTKVKPKRQSSIRKRKMNWSWQTSLDIACYSLLYGLSDCLSSRTYELDWSSHELRSYTWHCWPVWRFLIACRPVQFPFWMWRKAYVFMRCSGGWIQPSPSGLGWQTVDRKQFFAKFSWLKFLHPINKD